MMMLKCKHQEWNLVNRSDEVHACVHTHKQTATETRQKRERQREKDWVRETEREKIAIKGTNFCENIEPGVKG